MRPGKARHYGAGRGANVSAVQVEPNAFAQFCHLLFGRQASAQALHAMAQSPQASTAATIRSIVDGCCGCARSTFSPCVNSNLFQLQGLRGCLPTLRANVPLAV